MGVLTGIVMRTAEQGNPFFSSARCMNRKQTKHPCRVCSQLCPEEAIPGNPVIQKIDWGKCTNCGICVTACPSRCFAPDLKTQKNLSAPAKGGVAGFACYQAETEGSPRRVECLCAIPWEWLAALALRMQVVLYTGGCGSCQSEKCREQLEENLLQLRTFLGEERLGDRLILTDEPAMLKRMAGDAQMNRRDFFNIFTIGMKKTMAYGVSSVMPMPKDDPAKNGFTYRQLLADTVWQDYEQAVKRYRAAREMEDQEKACLEQARIPEYGVMLPDFNENCFGCGLCTKVCPQQALSISEEEEGSRIISVVPWRCTGCGLCSRVCIHKGIHGMIRRDVYHLEKQGYVRVYHEKCSQCGRAIPVGTAEGMCVACGVRKKRRGKK